MEQEDTDEAIAIDAAERMVLFLCQMYQPQDEDHEQQQDGRRTDESHLFAYGAENEVCVLLGHIFQFRLCTIQEALSMQAARSDSDF